MAFGVAKENSRMRSIVSFVFRVRVSGYVILPPLVQLFRCRPNTIP
jgi:hypothetical protein